MSELEWLKLLFAISFGVWTTVDLVFGTRYFRTLISTRFRVPFVLGTVIVSVLSTYEVTLYGFVLWFQPANRQLVMFALYSIAVVTILQALTFGLIANWVITKHVEPAKIPS